MDFLVKNGLLREYLRVIPYISKSLKFYNILIIKYKTSQPLPVVSLVH